MGLGVGLFLVAVGAVLAFAVNSTATSGIDVHAVGVILMLLGLAGIAASLYFWSSWAGPGYVTRRRRTIVDGGVDPLVTVPPRRRTTIVEDPMDPVTPVARRRRTTVVEDPVDDVAAVDPVRRRTTYYD